MQCPLVDPRGTADMPSPQQNPILSFLHTFPPKSTCVGGQHPPMGQHPPIGNPGSATDATCKALHMSLVSVICKFWCGVSSQYIVSNRVKLRNLTLYYNSDRYSSDTSTDVNYIRQVDDLHVFAERRPRRKLVQTHPM